MVGVQSGDVAFAISSDAIIAFAEAVMDDNPVYRHGTCIPPAFGLVNSGLATIELYRRLFPTWPDVDVIHLRSDSFFHRVLMPGRSFVARAETVGVTGTPSGALLHLRTSLGEPGQPEALVCDAAVIVPGITGPRQESESPHDRRPGVPGRRRSLGRRTIDIPGGHAHAYAAASGDWQQIHFDDEIAQQRGFARAVLHGACTMAMCAGAVTDIAGAADPARLAYLGMRFAAPVYPPASLTIDISEGTEHDGLRYHTVQAKTSGRPVIRGGRAGIRP